MKNRRITATSQVLRGEGYLTDVYVTASANDGKAIVYDGKDTNGEILVTVRCGDNLVGNFSPTTWPKFNVGLYVVVSGTDTSVNIGHRAT